MRIVADTNTLVSGFGWGGPPGQVVDTVLSGQVTLVISPALLGELARVLAYPKLTAILRGHAGRWTARLRSLTAWPAPVGEQQISRVRASEDQRAAGEVAGNGACGGGA